MKVSYDNLTHYKPAQVISGVRYSETNRTITENYPSAKIIMDELNKSSDQMKRSKLNKKLMLIGKATLFTNPLIEWVFNT
ncbi:hypothetical protein [Acinetobacter baumannii]|uniref:hypothetical protein n=1 Tax=Acinetobacter baumannii TaxID=470 RepID=UPI001D12345B|nr:hypothetical protein [Acinetobacter baumannii]